MRSSPEKGGGWWSRTSLRRKLILGAILVVVIIGLIVGLGVGLTIGRAGEDEGDNGNGGGGGPAATPTSYNSPLPSPNVTLPWTPKVEDSWAIVLLNNIEIDSDSSAALQPNVSIYDIDMTLNSPDTIKTLHGLGKKVLCYFSGGSYEPYRADSKEFKEDDMGKGLKGWPGERWLKLGSANVRRIMKARVEEAARRGCDGVDVDNVDGYQNENGIGLTADDSISFMAYLSSLTNPLNLTLGLKNAGDIIHYVLPIVHFSVNEQCVENSECETFRPFIDAGKPVFNIEYPDGAGSSLKGDVLQHFCGTTGAAQGRQGMSTVLKKMELDGWAEYCDSRVFVTKMNTTDPSG